MASSITSVCAANIFKEVICDKDNREKKNEIQKVLERELGTEVACVVEAGSKDLT